MEKAAKEDRIKFTGKMEMMNRLEKITAKEDMIKMKTIVQIKFMPILETKPIEDMEMLAKIKIAKIECMKNPKKMKDKGKADIDKGKADIDKGKADMDKVKYIRSMEKMQIRMKICPEKEKVRT